MSKVINAWATRQGVPMLVAMSVRNTLSKRRPILAQVNPMPATSRTGSTTALNWLSTQQIPRVHDPDPRLLHRKDDCRSPDLGPTIIPAKLYIALRKLATRRDKLHAAESSWRTCGDRAAGSLWGRYGVRDSGRAYARALSRPRRPQDAPHRRAARAGRRLHGRWLC